MKTILFATDFSETCENAFQYLKEFVEDSEIIVNIINVFDMPVAGPSAILTPSYESWIVKKKSRIEDDLNTLLNKLSVNNRGSVKAIYGLLPATDISKEVEVSKPNILVMGLRAKHSIVDKLVGTVTAQTIKKTHTPVLAIPFGAKYEGMKNILYATSITSPNQMFDSEEESLNQLLNLGKMFDDSKIEMLNIIKRVSCDKSIDINFKNRPFKGIDFIASEASTVEQGIQNNMNHKSTNLLIVQKSQSNFWDRVFGSSITRKLMLKVKIPIIVFQ